MEVGGERGRDWHDGRGERDPEMGWGRDRDTGREADIRRSRDKETEREKDETDGDPLLKGT